jgi:hypothetical protein
MKGRGIAMKTVGAAISEVDGGLGLLTQEEMYVWAYLVPNPTSVTRPLHSPTL